MLIHILEERNNRLYAEIRGVFNLLANLHVSAELNPYKTQLYRHCQDIQDRIEDNLANLETYESSALAELDEDLLADVLNETSVATEQLQLVSAKLLTPLLRELPPDKLCLSVINWLHKSHLKTEGIPPVFGDGHFAIYPFQEIAPFYVVPLVEQRGLLYLPLLFHEFGHLLFFCHANKTIELVTDLQFKIEDLLIPLSRRGDKHSAEQSSRRQKIVKAWFFWAQELFCDAVGFTMAGPCFLHAFSSFFDICNTNSFYRERHLLENSKHPITSLRIKFLARRAERAGLGNIMRDIQDGWLTTESILHAEQDFHGFYSDKLGEIVEGTIDAMIRECSPRPFTTTEVGDSDLPLERHSLVYLLNQAWWTFLANPEHYSQWETDQIKSAF